ncbi:hypothetical protein COU18_01140 [Candidatus Kaiserbacteria bacterium CG10_big_fil_rev_8_21_14_0_10_51_14]|uniref:Uncharacterized protein n=1 Tax=Candidatus Kaiserbacteria bacterium CG10_big_fil_rev_8_21_14_0_10_51_14 TaxID=1974610 RepID=A0A2H0UE93_9BACT|nr:MAG: hypothetical protein COU18_01140 [Candidatus Kaiserbacteria bacterium CG10_big_fil_rev_8_21_14_0_10_51_14]
MIVLVAYVLTYFLAQYLGALYALLFPEAVSTSFGSAAMVEWTVGLPITLVFLVTFLIHTLNGKHVWWWNIIALLPVILFEVVLDPLHLYVPLVIGALAWWLGKMANKGLWKLAPAFMARMS